MGQLFDLLFNPFLLIGLAGLSGFMLITLTHEVQVKWNIFIHFVIFVGVMLNVALSGVPLAEFSPLAWMWLAVMLFGSVFFYWSGLFFVSFFVLPLEPTAWNKWILSGQALFNFSWGRNYPYYGFDEESNSLKKLFDGKMGLRDAGPGIVLLQPEHAVVLHKGATITRVEGGDIVFTNRFERPLGLADLRNHILIMLNTDAVTKDGIGIRFHIFVPCRIDPENAPTDPERLYPFNGNTVAKVLTEQDVEDGKNHPWYQLVIKKAKKVGCDVVSGYVLDRLFSAEDGESLPMEEVRGRIQARLQAEMAGTGIDIPGVGIGNFVPNDDLAEQERKRPAGQKEYDSVPIHIKEQRIDSWKAKWQRKAIEREARGEAEAIQILEQARARALTELINSVSQGFKEIEANGNAVRPDEIIALSFINAIEQVLSRQDLPHSLDGDNPPQSTMQDVRRLMFRTGN